MICKKCGKEIEEGLEICYECEAQEKALLEVIVDDQKVIEQKDKSEGKLMGVLSAVFGFAGLYIPLFNTVAAVLAIVFGFMARKTKGEDLGIIGIILGFLYFIVQAVSIVMVIFIYAFIFLFYILMFVFAMGSTY